MASNIFQRLARNSLRYATANTPFRGRHRLVRAISTRLGSDTEYVRRGPLNIEIDHTIYLSRLFYYGVYEEHLVNWIDRAIRPGDKVIEPGMNKAFITSCLLRAIGDRGLVVALEPSRRCIDAFRAGNDLSTLRNLVVLNAAIASRTGTEIFFESSRIFSHGYSCLESAGAPSDAISYEVNTFSVDDLMATHGIDRLRFLKLDVEGSELAAIEGARASFDAGLIDYVMVETDLDPSCSRTLAVAERITDLLSSAGFAPHLMSRAGSLQRFDIRSPFSGRKRFRKDVMWARV